MRKLLLATLLFLCPAVSAQLPAIGGKGGIVNLPGGGAVVFSMPVMLGEMPAVYAIYSDRSWIVTELNGDVTQGQHAENEPLPGAGSLDWYYTDGNESWQVHQDCKSMTKANCLKAFMKLVKLMKEAIRQQNE